MKKLLLTLLVLLWALPFVWATPAIRTPFPYTQPDGTQITLRIHGDEYFHWYSDESGQIVEKGADGFFRPASMNFAARAAASRRRQEDEMYIKWSDYENAPVTNFGDRKVLCIIANFTDSTFVVDNPREHFYNMLNLEGYSENGSIGSVRDYYLDNSWNGSESVYRPQFDVYGPVQLTQSSKYYDDNGAYLAILEAYELMQDQIPIEDYDTDGDGKIDMVLFYYPGHNQAEGAGEESIWPHQSTGNFGNMGSKQFVRYFCTSELRGIKGATPASIGTTCHEFAHSLGLPDFYDTDYAANGGDNFPDGYASTSFDLMAGGNYNDNGRRPPYLSVLERNMLGWMDYPDPLTVAGEYALEPVQGNHGYRVSTSVPGEFFYMEYRNAQKWDSMLPGGLLFYHVDQSDRVVPLTEGHYGSSRTAKQLWETNKINCFYGHPCYYLVPSVFQSFGNKAAFVFPGLGSVMSYVPQDWDGLQTGLAFSNISHNGSSCAFTVHISSQRLIFGYVFDTNGKPIAGAEVSLTPSEAPFAAAPALVSTSLTTTTDAAGYYALELENEAYAYQILRVWKEGYVADYTDLSLSGLYSNQDFTLLRTGEGSPANLYKFNANLKSYNVGIGAGEKGERAVAMRYAADELSSMGAVGALLRSVRFKVGSGAPGNIEKTYVLVGFDDDIVLCREIESSYAAGSYQTVDISNENLTIPEGKDLYIGYGFTGVTAGNYPFSGYLLSDNPDGSYYLDNFLTPGPWALKTFTNQENPEACYAGFNIAAEIVRVKEVEFSELGVSYIQVTENVPTVVVASGKSLRSTTWYLDGTPVAEPTPINELAAGSHTYMVRLQFYDGTVERVFYDVD